MNTKIIALIRLQYHALMLAGCMVKEGLHISPQKVNNEFMYHSVNFIGYLKQLGVYKRDLKWKLKDEIKES